jgi:hypothetical protein
VGGTKHLCSALAATTPRPGCDGRLKRFEGVRHSNVKGAAVSLAVWAHDLEESTARGCSLLQ